MSIRTVLQYCQCESAITHQQVLTMLNDYSIKVSVAIRSSSLKVSPCQGQSAEGGRITAIKKAGVGWPGSGETSKYCFDAARFLHSFRVSFHFHRHVHTSSCLFIHLHTFIHFGLKFRPGLPRFWWTFLGDCIVWLCDLHVRLPGVAMLSASGHRWSRFPGPQSMAQVSLCQ